MSIEITDNTGYCLERKIYHAASKDRVPFLIQVLVFKRTDERGDPKYKAIAEAYGSRLDLREEFFLSKNCSELFRYSDIATAIKEELDEFKKNNS